MVGNDIVDLNSARIQTDWQRKGFLTKIFTSYELTMIENSRDPFQFVWLFWSMKESAYKCYVQQKEVRFFAPKKLQCELISENLGAVSINDERYYTHSKVTNDYILTNAGKVCNAKAKNICFEFNTEVRAEQSHIVHLKLKKEISKNLHVPVDELSIKKNSFGVPKLYRNKQQLQVSISMSHHGNYGAYSVLNKNI